MQDNYCREVEAHLCRRNQGHLIRIVGPAFELVAGWAAKGIPLSVVCAGIDRTVERQDKKGPRRRPVRIEFCEADVLDAFDTWRRAVGVAGLSAPPASDNSEAEGEVARGGRRRPALVAHLDRVLARLTALRGSDRQPAGLAIPLEETVRAIDGLRAAAPRARGDARATLVAELAALDRALIERAVEALDSPGRAAAEADARRALASYRERMAPEAYQRALAAAIERHVRDRIGLPLMSYDPD